MRHLPSIFALFVFVTVAVRTSAAPAANIPPPPSRAVVAAALAALAQDGSNRDDIMNTLMRFCGPRGDVALKLKDFLQDKNPETRCGAAKAAGFCRDGELGLHVFGRSGAHAVPIPLQTQLIPALAHAALDSNTRVRLAALKSLEVQTEVFSIVSDRPGGSSVETTPQAVWQRAVPFVAQDAVSRDPKIRLAALRVLAYIPTDISSVAGCLRPGLRGNGEEQNYALAALCHAAQRDRSMTFFGFFQDLASADVSKRRRAAADIHLAAIPLFSGEFFPDPNPLPDWFNDSRLHTATAANNPLDRQQQQEIQRHSADAKQAEGFMLLRLIAAVGDPDAAVRKDAAGSLENIGRWTYSWLGVGVMPNPGAEAYSQVVNALTQAADAAQPRDAQTAAQLRAMRAQVTAPRAKI